MDSKRGAPRDEEARVEVANASTEGVVRIPRSRAEIEELQNSEGIGKLNCIHSEERGMVPVFANDPGQEDDSQDHQVHVDVSLPGTPLSSDLSGRSSRSAGSVSTTTPTYIRLDEGMEEATVHDSQVFVNHKK